MPIYFPPLTPSTTGEESAVILGTRVFGPRPDVSPLQHAAVRSFVGLNTGTSTPDDADAIIANQSFGP
jgi:hypothetical protein